MDAKVYRLLDWHVPAEQELSADVGTHNVTARLIEIATKTAAGMIERHLNVMPMDADRYGQFILVIMASGISEDNGKRFAWARFQVAVPI